MTHLQLLVIKTRQPETLAAFYTLLGIEFEYHQHGKGPFHYASKNGLPVIEIYPLPANALVADNTTRLGFGVTHLDELIARLQQQHMPVVSMPEKSEWGYRAIVQDPDGRKIELTEIPN
ncbi:glyoxalase/bleomycin resistance/extradiol dioxygenase family protein [Chitinophaga oryzae]|uniref:Glyoxalase/bleomycin resistance/extradiol dioxygenase family protein n=1 Tax=Chitinophaga oryzae TaxID=2725414 RepID=A0AAE7D7B8_9BACT|nr:VOC family protein [Chitinophaga oryzae]QJB32086.1 glyoxalase/bleomycin resistance/extradiol dioxygenase family protein [Chitinophaga oryzae]QJB38564.1 glyoxalase/bleomycin resistance/extradiol dioxygenase family protein [Chitinophaga oryzae]